jgi:hypothetical protein
MNRMMLAFVSSIAAGSLATPAIAGQEPSTKLVRCADQSCLRVSGHRDDPASIVHINGHAVPVEGDRKWKVSLPLEVVREWSAPNARTIEVSLGGPEGHGETVDLPIGLLANATTVAALVINVH